MGHGLGIASGLAIGNKKINIYVVLSDGELMEGSNWEYILTISSLKLNNVCIFIDFNGLQSSTWSKDTHPTLTPLDKKFKAFGWGSAVCKGNDLKDIYKKFSNREKNKPFALICKTTKGYPIPFMMNKPIWHYRSPNKEEHILSINYLKKFYKKK